jgi:hypothetical protein
MTYLLSTGLNAPVILRQIVIPDADVGASHSSPVVLSGHRSLQRLQLVDHNTKSPMGFAERGMSA